MDHDAPEELGEACTARTAQLYESGDHACALPVHEGDHACSCGFAWAQYPGDEPTDTLDPEEG